MNSALNDSPPPYGTLVFDCDSTLASIEGIDELARSVLDVAPKTAHEIAALTERAMNGELDLDRVYARRLELLSPDRAALERLGKLYIEAVLPHAVELVSALCALDKRVAILSGGLRQALLPLARHLGVSEEDTFGVELFFDRQGRYAGFDTENPLARGGGKLLLLRELGRGERRGGLALVGDGFSDLEAAVAARRFVAFAGVVSRERVVKAARAVCREPDLAALVPWLLAPDEIARLSELPDHAPLLFAARALERRAR